MTGQPDVERGAVPAAPGLADKGPVIIGGLAHSGKTELRRMLARHTRISLTRGTRLWDRYYGRYGDLRRQRDLERCLAAMAEDADLEALGPDIDQIRAEFVGGPRTYGRLFGLVHAQHAARFGRDRWGDQLGFVERYAAPLFGALPASRMIHLIRDPRDLWALAPTTRRTRPGKLGWATERWRFSSALGLSNRARFPARYLMVHYEELLGEPEASLREIFRFIDEPFSSEMIDEEVQGWTDRLGSGRRVGAGLSSRDGSYIEAKLRAQMAAFGYPPKTRKLEMSERVGAALIDRPANQIGAMAWRIVKKRPFERRSGDGSD